MNRPPLASTRGNGGRTIALCFIAALLEGADIVSMGLVAPSVARVFGFSPGQISYILTAAIAGLMIGAAAGGRIGDRIGRKWTLIGAFVVLGIFAILTAFATSLEQFLLIRFLCGLGMGAAFPNLISIAAEAARSDRLATGVGLMFAGQPTGGTLLALFVATRAGTIDWATIFWICGVLPLLIVPLLMVALPESQAFRKARAAQSARPAAGLALFGEGRTPVTLLMWVAYAFTQVIVYLINNWLPTLMVAKGFTPQQAGLISAFENGGAVAGCALLAMIADRGRTRLVLVVTYFAMTIGLWGLGEVTGFWPVVAVGIVVGFFVIGGQLVLYTMTPRYYPTLMRATGVGAAVSFGRLGGIAGPLAAGKLLAIGMTPAAVLVTATPCALLAGIAAVALSLVRTPNEL